MYHNLNMKTKDSYKQKVLQMASKTGVVRMSDLTKQGITRATVSRLVNENKLEKLAPGLYCLSGTELSEKESLVIVASRVPQAVFCLLTALQIYDLTTQLPRKVWISMPKGSHVPKMDYPPLKMVQYSDEAFSEGIEIIESDNIKLRVYNLAKTIADCFKHRNKIGLDVAIEALKEAYSKNKVTVDELWHYAKICRVANVMRPYIEAIQ
ncbi:type IV toxin-antitoxin system AbiEi family antitoxin domain-containing protein [Legionella quinlivanii]|uniref:type IV toxin-antitoxin system AbiEi family antitoxin domain-containing protein n=1 Tax=Legionella quinlivanii TaxID=45073 RepID=UPI00224424E8|nr:AbiEi antitoxin N-terminal domain-containing protein [Legionella quinlivanii]MCW8451804.1 type IV toxin-antitoxin system AbiEi family antitoxin domain-containing protein [Legionella quinlivanii]